MAAEVTTTSDNDAAPPSLLSRVTFRTIGPTDINRCHEIEKASYPQDEAATRSALQYRQHHAEKYFRCAVLRRLDDDDDEEEDHDEREVIGFICATRTNSFDHESMSAHNHSGRLLAIHSVVVEEPYRRQGVASAMLQDYVQTVKMISAQQRSSADACHIETLVLMAKSHLIGLYCTVGFHCLGVSPIVHGSEQWFHLELTLVQEDEQEKAAPVGLPFWTVDAFTRKAGGGNPAAVVVLPKALSAAEEAEKAEWFKLVAAEFNLSETAFVWALKKMSTEDDIRGEDGKRDEEATGGAASSDYAIRYFTPTVEVDLCGHATLASAAVLFQQNSKLNAITFHAKKDVLGANRAQQQQRQLTENNDDDDDAIDDELRISMNFPQKALTELGEDDKVTLLDMLRSTFTNVSLEGENNVQYAGIDEDGGDVLVELTKECFDSVDYGPNSINYQNLMTWDGYSRGILLCCTMVSTDGDGTEEEEEDTSTSDFQSRCFFPKCGISEDPVTGSAHCTLTPYFASKLGKTTSLIAHQASKRGGWIECNVHEEQRRVELIGSAVIVTCGTLLI